MVTVAKSLTQHPTTESSNPLAHGQRRNGKPRRLDSLPISSGRNAQGRVYTFYPHAGSLASAEERQEQPASAGFFLPALSTGANLVSSTKRGYAMKDIAHCQRCGEFKDRHWFPSEMVTWYQLCNRCIRSPSGAMPLPQEECDRNEHQAKPNASNAI